MKPFFSIIVPCCDVEPYLRESLDSVLKQPFADWECILGVIIKERPGADIYPCAIQVHNDMTGKDEELRDNYPKDFSGELTGPEAVIKAEQSCHDVCPMLQLSVFRR